MIAFTEPTDFEAALKLLKAKKLLPTNLSSAELRELAQALRERSLFSARTTKVDLLQTYREQIAEMVNGDTNIATARARVQDMIDALGYKPETGFAGDEELDIPPAEAGSIRDIASNGRVDLVLRTNMQQVSNWAFREAGQTPGALQAWPCYELVRIAWRAVPRGQKLTKAGLEDVPGEDWPSRWEEMDGEFYDGRMIARKDDPIWEELGSSENFDDALDTDVPPFAFNSGYGWREVSRGEAIELGVIEADDMVDAEPLKLNESLQVNAAKFDADFLKALRNDLSTAISNGRLKLQ